MNIDSKIFVAGHTGLVGSALLRALAAYPNIQTASHTSLDLTKRDAVLNFFSKKQPEYVFLAAAKVGGILYNDTSPVNFLDENCRIQLNVLYAAAKFNIKKLLFLGSSCIYPKDCPQPIKEESILAGKLEPTNDAYAIAKLSGIIGCRSYNRQLGTNFVAAMPANLYGQNDNFDLTNSHVLPALIRKIHNAKCTHAPTLTLWGSGKPRREFLHVDDLARALIHIMHNYTPASPALEDIVINIGTGRDISIAQLANLISSIIGYEGKIIWDISKPDGTLKKVLCVDKLMSLRWHPIISLKSGIEMTYKWFLENKI
jgi:GDP-L-fucose synthase